VRGCGLWLGIDFTTDKKTRAPFPMSGLNSLVERAKGKGFLIKLMGQAIELAPPFIIERDEIDQGIRVLDECIREEAKEMGLH
jgi:adenosylmethionine-8-amino-7-oxononanoate aminotransferase